MPKANSSTTCTEPAIIISASGMCEHGRILHHLANNIAMPDNTILFVGYQAENTLGRKIAEGVSPVRIFDEDYPVRANIVKLDGYSAHADQQELLAWVGGFDRARLQRVFVVHGEATATETFSGKLRAAGIANVDTPARGQSFDL